MNNKAVTTPITVFFWLITFAIVWALALGEIVNVFAQQGVTYLGGQGLGAFLLNNFNFTIMIIILVFILAITFIGNQ